MQFPEPTIFIVLLVLAGLLLVAFYSFSSPDFKVSYTGTRQMNDTITYTVTPRKPITGNITYTYAGAGLSGSSTLTFAGTAAQTFTLTPSAVDNLTVTFTNALGLRNAKPFLLPIYQPAFTVAKTGLLDSTILANYAAPNNAVHLSITPTAKFTGTLTITPSSTHAVGGSETTTAQTLSWAGDRSTQVANFTPTLASDNYTLTFTSNKSPVLPSPIVLGVLAKTYTITATGNNTAHGAVSTVTVTPTVYASGGKFIGSIVITPTGAAMGTTTTAQTLTWTAADNAYTGKQYTYPTSSTTQGTVTFTGVGTASAPSLPYTMTNPSPTVITLT